MAIVKPRGQESMNLKILRKMKVSAIQESREMIRITVAMQVA